MGTYYLVVSNMYLHDTLDASIVNGWFPLHFIHGSRSEYATGFAIVASRAEVLEVLLKAQLMLGSVTSMTQQDFARWLRSFDGNHRHEMGGRMESESNGGTAVTLRSWLLQMRRAEESGEEEGDEGEEDEDAEDDLYVSAVQSAFGDDDDDVSMDCDSDGANFQDERYKPSDVINDKFLEAVCLDMCERRGLPASSSFGVLI